MLIRHKGIYRDRFEDAPWVGTLVSAISCPHNCPNCINDSVKSAGCELVDLDKLIDSIAEDNFNEGIILAGLEWSCQPEELCIIISRALKSSLKIILYTYHCDKESLLKVVPALRNFEGNGILVKYGNYNESMRVHDYWDHGVKLATSNQYIEEL